MNLFKSVTFTWRQVALFKLCLLSLGIIIGAYFATFFLQWIPVLALIFIVTVVYLVYVWWKE